LSEATPEELAQMSAVLDRQIKEYFPNDPKKLADKKAIEIEQRRRAGEVVERPAEPTQTATAQAEIARLREENNKIQQDVLAKQKKEGLDKPRLTLAQLSKIEENNRRIAQLESKLAKADDVAVQQQGQQTAQQIDDARDVASMQTDNLGALGEFREGADELEAQPTELGELDSDAMEAENQTMLDALQDEDVQALLPEEAKASLRDADTLIAKAEQYEEIVEAGRVCVVGSKGT